MTIDLSRRKLLWRCDNCHQDFEENIMNLKQKDVAKMSDEEQSLLADLVYVSVHLHEPTLGRNWSELLEQPESWQHWLEKLPDRES